MEYSKPTSFSQNMLFEKCPRSWYYKYVKKVPPVEDLKYAHRGTIVHTLIETFLKNKQMYLSELRKQFDELWDKYKLDTTSLRTEKKLTWEMIMNGLSYEIKFTDMEYKIMYPDVVGIIDVMDQEQDILVDWKTSTRSKENEQEYLKQLIFYSWLYYRKFNKLPKKVGVVYLKYREGYKRDLFIEPTMAQVKEIEQWHNQIRQKMQYYVENEDKLPEFNYNFNFSPYKHLWDLDTKDIMLFNIDLYGNFFYISGIDDFLSRYLDEKFSFVLKNAYFIQQQRPGYDGKVKLWDKSKNRLPIGFFDDALKVLKDYGEYRKKTPFINVYDRRITNHTTIEMPDKLLSGKQLRDYQLKGVDIFLNKKIGLLEIATGGGKTLLAAEIIRRLGVMTLFIVDKIELMRQTIDVLSTNLGITVGMIGTGEMILNTVTVATIQSLMSKLNELGDYLSQVRFVIMDEAHKVAAKSYYKIGSYLRNTEYRLGITATAFRDDGNDMLIAATLGKILYNVSSSKLINEGYLVKPEIVFIKYSLSDDQLNDINDYITESLDDEMLATQKYLIKYKGFIVNNKIRNLVIKDLVFKNPDKRILILVRMIEHGKLLESLIPDSRYLYGNLKKLDRLNYFSDFRDGRLKVLISTVSIFAEGIDIPELDIIVNASANKGDVKTLQILGRVLRKSQGKDKAYYYDFIDEYDGFSSGHNSRKDILKEEGHVINILDYNL